jgi:glycosyltransferase involved in cell wall biosynthesis
VVTFVARSLDRLRGFDRFIDLANRLLRERPDVLCIVAGAPTVQHSLDVEFYNQDYSAHLLANTPLADPERVWFLDFVKPETVAEMLSASDLHVYPSRPYPVSRSVLEAMASGCVVLAWDTEPVREFITHRETGLLVSDADALAQALEVLAGPESHRSLGDAAAALVREKYSREVTMPLLADQLRRLVEARL